MYDPCSSHAIMKFYSELVEYTVMLCGEMLVRIRLLPVIREHSSMVERFTD